ncbi:hypothetical protein CEP54_002240, partial [Fusarium duplospermum]
HISNTSSLHPAREFRVDSLVLVGQILILCNSLIASIGMFLDVCPCELRADLCDGIRDFHRYSLGRQSFSSLADFLRQPSWNTLLATYLSVVPNVFPTLVEISLGYPGFNYNKEHISSTS